ncbi:MAG: hypothetical protein HC894_29145 [Microcoleus sp. SM1_3_4]|nr:hypothetical protein [Microcoleus sp. SM1_3_4]
MLLKRLSLLGTLAASLVAFTPLGYAAGKDDNVVIPEDCLDALKKMETS